MSKNQRHRSDWGDGIVLEIPVPDTAVPGVPMAFGSDGLYGIPETVKATAERLRMGTAPASTRLGNAGVQFPGIGQTRDLGPIPAGIAEYGKVYLDAAGKPAATGSLHIGYKLGNLVLIRNN